LIEAARLAWLETDPEHKCARVAALTDGRWIASTSHPPLDLAPGRPQRPALVHPRDVPRRALGTIEGRAALLHAVAHIEFNAINLALDAALRFAGLPPDYYRDWISVAQDEARHFLLLRARLRGLGYDYGDFEAHNGLWEAAEKTAHDVLVRMALVPRVLEARGLDVTPGLIRRLRETGDADSVAALQVILDEEVRHVAIGTRWFRHLCAQRKLPPADTFGRLLAEYNMRLRPPFNRPARLAAGFDPAEFEMPSEGDSLET
jgi:uncharacterized ferritin-like protein (DUF455 family)